jgi:glycosyltransferase involved in cell wall biosynthesis
MSTVSVLMPVFNAARFLDAAIDSIRRQSVDDWELVVVNDGSTDDTLAIIRRHAGHDGRIVVVDKANGGIADALNAGLAVCRAPLIARMDGDDVAEADRLAVQRAFLAARPEIGAVGGWATVMDENSIPIGRLTHPTDPSDVDRAVREGSYAMLHPTMMIRRDVLATAGDYDRSFRYAEDLDLLLRLSEVTALANLPRTVLTYRRRGQTENTARGEVYPIWDQRALLAANARGRRPISAATLARAANRVSWTALNDGDYRTAVAQAWRAARHAPFSTVGMRAFARVGWRSAIGKRGKVN